VDPNGVGVRGAPVTVNGRIVNTNSQGRFNLEVPLSDRYVLTVRGPSLSPANQTAYGMISFVYTNSIVGGRWVLRPAQITSIDPTRSNSIQHKRSERDCMGSLTSKIDWSKYQEDGLNRMARW
jgi:hypothetical protein